MYETCRLFRKILFNIKTIRTTIVTLYTLYRYYNLSNRFTYTTMNYLYSQMFVELCLLN